MEMTTSQFQTTDVVCGSTAETKKITVQPIPKPKASARNRTDRKFHRQWPMVGAGQRWQILRRLSLPKNPSTARFGVTDARLLTPDASSGELPAYCKAARRAALRFILRRSVSYAAQQSSDNSTFRPSPDGALGGL
jgi:hypothetical protein